MARESTEGLAIRGYLAVVLRWKWLIIGIMAVCLVGGVGYLYTATPMYEATAKLLYVQPVTISNSLVQGIYSQNLQQPDVATVSAIVGGGQVTSAAAELLRGKDTSAGYYVDAISPTDANGNYSSTMVGVHAVSVDPATAANAANAFAQAFVDYRRDNAKGQVEGALKAVEAALQSYDTATERESAEYLQLRQSQQALQLQLESLSSDFSIISRATTPTEPFSPRTRHTLALAVILGLALSMGLAFLLEQLDTRIRNERDMTDMLGLSVLGHLPPLTRRTGDGATVQMLVNPSGPMAEAVRVLRGNLSFTGVDDDVRSVLFTSSIRSEGKSVTACNLAVSMALAGQRVVLVDADFRRPRVHAYMRVSNTIGLSSVLARRAELKDAVLAADLGSAVGMDGALALAQDVHSKENIRVRSIAAGGQLLSGAGVLITPQSTERTQPSTDGEPMLRILPSGPLPPNPGEMAASLRFGEIIASLADTADLVIIDSPPLLEVGDTAAMAGKADGVVFVVNIAKVRWPMLERSRAQLDKFPCRKLGLVVVAPRSARKPVYGYYGRPPSA